MKNPTSEILRQLLIYEPDTGKLFWRERPVSFFNDTAGRTAEHSCSCWNARYAGTEALACPDKDGYLHGGIFGRLHKAHRVIWAMQTGEWPKGELDHEDTDRSNNRWGNIREATRSEQMQNQRLPESNSSGVKGVSWHKDRQKWQANITVNGRRKYLGLFDDLRLAEARVIEEREKLHGHFARAA